MTIRIFAACAAITAAGALLAPGTLATSIPLRTYVGSVAPDGSPANGASQHPSLSTTGRVLAFDTTATNIAGPDGNGAVRDVVAIDLATNERRLVSLAPGGPPANGPSFEPVLSGDGQRVAFTSAASNLVDGDTNGQPDVFVRQGRDRIVRVSTAINGAAANGASGSPDISADGNRVVFVSSASNLVPGDTNGQPDVFVRDLSTNKTTRVSVSSGGTEAHGRSSAPAISANGRFVAFSSGAPDLVSRDNNGIMDVFVRDLVRGTTERVSVSSKGRQQNRSVQPPFVQIPDISDDGRYVVFDSDATTLYSPDTNKHTDVFLRDRKKHITTLVSASSTNVQGNNDTFAPKLSPRGRYLSYQSFSTNLAPGDGPREDIFVRDLRLGTTSVVNVTATGAPRGNEQVPQLLQRPALSSDGRIAAFSSTVTNLTSGDTNGAEDVFVRFLDAPEATITVRPPVDHGGTVRVGTDDPGASTPLCQVDNGPVATCSRDIPIRGKIGRVLKIRAGGPGMLYSDQVLTVPLSSDHSPPRLTISRPRGSRLAVLRGRSADRSGISFVQVFFVYGTRGRCKYLAGRHSFSRRFTPKACSTLVPITIRGGRTWRLRLPHAIRGDYAIFARAVDRVGNSSRVIGLLGHIG